MNWANQKDQEAYTKGKKTFLDDVIHQAKKTQSQTSFMKHQDWNLNNSKVTLNGHLKKHEFLKAKRMTFNEDIYRKAKLYKVPGIGEYAYQNFPKPRICSVPKSTADQRSLVNDSKFKGMQVPGHKYDVSCYLKTRPRILDTKIYAAKDKFMQWKIPKSKNPAIGQYDDLSAFNKTALSIKNHNALTSKA